jgi:hypothetical protein
MEKSSSLEIDSRSAQGNPLFLRNQDIHGRFQKSAPLDPTSVHEFGLPIIPFFFNTRLNNVNPSSP